MTESGYIQVKTAAPSQDLRHLLQTQKWKSVASDVGNIVTVELPWKGPLNPFGLVNFNRQCWKFFWRSKDCHEVIVGMGSLFSYKSSQAVTQKGFAGQRFFGGLAFPATSLGEEWQEFSHEFMVLPEVEWKLGETSNVLTLRVLAAPEDNQDSILAKLMTLYRDYTPATLSGVGKGADNLVRMEYNYPPYQEWQGLIQEIIGTIRDKNAEKIVLSRMKEVTFEHDIDLGLLMSRLAAICERSYLFLFMSPSGKAFVGRSPERLLSWDHQHVYVDAVAGTRKRSQGSSQDFTDAQELRTSLKDLEEHRFVTSFVKNTLERYCEKVIQTEKEQLFRLKNVQHIRSQFQANTQEGCSPVDLLRALHPTPAVGGCPTAIAAQYINASEPFSRGLFTGAVGFTDGSNGDFAIGIRSALINGARARIYAGAGIVSQSDPAAEWAETEVKMKNFSDIFSLGIEDHEPRQP